MIRKQKTTGAKNDSHGEWKSQLSDILTLRSQGLLTQSEYEEKLQQVEHSLPREARLAEHELPRGRSRFVLREASSGRVLGEFDFHDGHEVDR
jgi:hypothetical protein